MEKKFWPIAVVIAVGLPLLFLSKLRPGAFNQGGSQVHVSSGPSTISILSILVLVAAGIVFFLIGQRRKK